MGWGDERQQQHQDEAWIPVGARSTADDAPGPSGVSCLPFLILGLVVAGVVPLVLSRVFDGGELAPGPQPSAVQSGAGARVKVPAALLGTWRGRLNRDLDAPDGYPDSVTVTVTISCSVECTSGAGVPVGTRVGSAVDSAGCQYELQANQSLDFAVGVRVVTKNTGDCMPAEYAGIYNYGKTSKMQWQDEQGRAWLTGWISPVR
jgi:hypothetical protein